MICPICGSEYRTGYTRCADCDVELTEPQTSPPQPEVTLVKVYETGNPAIIPLLESVFEDAGIDVMTNGERVQELFGWGRFGTNLNPVVGPVQFFVRKEDEQRALELIDVLDRVPVFLPEEPEEPH